MKMRYVRKTKKADNKNPGLMVRKNNEDPMDAVFPEIEEYFMYTPKIQIHQQWIQKVLKLQRTQSHIVHLD
jgi:hypothetical protein